MIDAGIPFEFELRFRSVANGDYRWFLARGVPQRDRHGKILRWYGILTDIEDRKQAEQALRLSEEQLKIEVEERSSLLAITHDSISVVDMGFSIRYWNQGAEEFYGWTQHEAIGKRSDELLRTIYPKPVEEILEELMAKDQWEGELKRIKADSVQVVVSSRWSLRRDQQNRPVAILETSNDITARKRWEEEIQSLNQELAKRSMALETSNKDLEGFAYSVSHDLRAPLRHVAGFAELLRKTATASLSEKSNRYINLILDEANRMGSLIDDLLAFSRITRAETHYSMISLEQLVADAIADVSRDAGDREIIWKTHPLPEWCGDRSMLRLALVNLISNALKFTRKRKDAQIEIGCTERKADHIVLFVRDNGVGFDMKYYSKLFGVFQRLHPQDDFEGTGIGLATVQRIVHHHGGQVWAESKVDGGATFYFSLYNIRRADGSAVG